jgi:hypothetical protein
MAGMVDAVLQVLIAVLAQHLEDRQVLVALDQCQHGGRDLLQRVEEPFPRRVAQAVVQVVQALRPQARQLVRPRLLRALGRVQQALQLRQVHQRTAGEQRCHLLGGLDHVAAGQQQGAVMVADVERQGCAHLDTLLNLGKG